MTELVNNIRTDFITESLVSINLTVLPVKKGQPEKILYIKI